MDVIVERFEDHPDRVREVFTDAGYSAVAHVVAHTCQHQAPTLVFQNVLKVVTDLTSIQSAGHCAAVLGRTPRALATELRDGRVLPCKELLPWLRILPGSRLVRHGVENLDGLASILGYRSVRALYHAFHRHLAAGPSDVAARGGLWFASQRFRQALASQAA